jgi:prevent-host-death family protein
MRWQFQEAKAELSELVKQAEAEGPQEITVQGRTRAVLIAQAEHERLVGAKPAFWEFMRASPLLGVDLDLNRDKADAMRDVKL